ncbi:MAG: hypothetical protein JO306_09330 [Gemmatimonadetes bacterium]|nr:hypothetical protein [Gemmatimonadota bacterium]
MAVIGGGFAAVFVIGILAVLAIPRFTQAAERAKQQEGTRMLRDAYIAEQRYFVDHGDYTANIEDLKASGWKAPAVGNFTLRVSDDSKERLCLEAEPKPGVSGVHAMSMDAKGEQFPVSGCGYPDPIMQPGGDAATDRPADLYADRDTTGRRLMAEVYAGIVAYRAEHGRDPTELAQVTSGVHQTPASRIYAMHVSHGRNGFCVIAQPQEYPDDVHSWGVDAKGLLYDTAVCKGEAVDSLHAAPAADR